MAQFIRPASDKTVNSWTTTPLWDKIDEVSASDADFISSPSQSAGTSFCEIGLSTDGLLPGSGTCTLRYRYRKSASGGRTIDLTASLYEGSTLIATGPTHANIGDAFTDGSFDLSQGERDSITDWSNLNVRFHGSWGGSAAGRSLQISWMELETPDSVIKLISAAGGIPSAEAFGAPSLDRSYVPAGGAMAVPYYFLDEPTGPPAQTISPAAIASEESFGTPGIITGAVTVSPPSIASAESFGNPTVAAGALTLLPDSIPSGEAFGTPNFTLSQFVLAEGIPSEESFGQPLLSLGDLMILPIGIASDETFGSVALVPGVWTLLPDGIPSEEVVGSPALSTLNTLLPSEIASEEAFGIPALQVPAWTISPTGIESTEAFGVPSFPVPIKPIGIVSGEAFGIPRLRRADEVGLIFLTPAAPFKVVISELNGPRLEELPFKGLEVSWVLNDEGPIQFSIPLLHPKADRNLIAVGERELEVFRYGQLIWGGYLWAATPDIRSETLRIAGATHFSRLKRRHIDIEMKLVNIDQFDIAWTILEWTQSVPYGDLGIIRDSAALSGKLRERKFWPWERLNVAEELISLAEAHDGFDFEITPDKRWKTFHTNKGQQRNEVRFELGKNVEVIQFEEDATDVVSEFTGLGAGSGKNRCIAVVNNLNALTRYGLLQDSDDWDEVKHYQLMADKAKEQLRLRKRPRMQPTITVQTSEPSFGAFEVGDDVWLKAKYGNYVSIDQFMRVVALTDKIDDAGKETFEVHLEQETVVPA